MLNKDQVTMIILKEYGRPTQLMFYKGTSIHNTLKKKSCNPYEIFNLSFLPFCSFIIGNFLYANK